jgi:hypothetical protein
MTVPAEQAAIIMARLMRQQCVCQEEAAAPPCECAAPVTRAQIGRLRAYRALHPEREFVYSERAGEWLAALGASLPADDNAVTAWLLDPFALPPAADLHHAGDLGTLLDALDALPTATLS